MSPAWCAHCRRTNAREGCLAASVERCWDHHRGVRARSRGYRRKPIRRSARHRQPANGVPERSAFRSAEIARNAGSERYRVGETGRAFTGRSLAAPEGPTETGGRIPTGWRRDGQVSDTERSTHRGTHGHLAPRRAPDAGHFAAPRLPTRSASSQHHAYRCCRTATRGAGEAPHTFPVARYGDVTTETSMFS